MSTDTPVPLAITVPAAPHLEIVPMVRGHDLILIVNGANRCLGRIILEGIAAPSLDLANVRIGDHHFVPEPTR